MPEGTYAVGAGLMVAGITTYGFFVFSSRALSNTDYNALIGGLWPLVFVAAPGCFLPLEQEVGRAVAHRRAQGIGGGPLVRRAAFLGASLVAGLLAFTVVAEGVFGAPITDHLFQGRGVLLVCFLLALCTYACQHLTRGTLSGNGRFGPYGTVLGAEGVIRLLPVAVLLFIGVDQVGYYGLCFAIPPLLASAIALRGQHGLLAPGPEAPWSELSTHLGLLLLGSVLAQALSYAPILAANALGSGKPHRAVAGFVSGFFLARIPILLYQAVQAALLPKLAGLAGAGRHDAFRAGLRRLVMVVVAVGAIGVVGGFTLGPFAGRILFHDKFQLGHVDLALLAAGSGAFILALTMAQALIALMGHGRSTLSWLIGIVAGGATLGALTALDVELFLRIELSFIVASLGTVALMLVMLLQQMRAGVPDTADALVEVLEHEPLEI
jgi:O-antigen/teichoic acid export membrane protein